MARPESLGLAKQCESTRRASPKTFSGNAHVRTCLCNLVPRGFSERKASRQRPVTYPNCHLLPFLLRNEPWISVLGTDFLKTIRGQGLCSAGHQRTHSPPDTRCLSSPPFPILSSRSLHSERKLPGRRAGLGEPVVQGPDVPTAARVCACGDAPIRERGAEPPAKAGPPGASRAQSGHTHACQDAQQRGDLPRAARRRC